MEKGKLVIRGLAVEDLAPYTTFEDTVFLLWHDALPDAEALNRFSGELATHRELERHTLELLSAVAARQLHTMDALLMACASLTGDVAVAAIAAGDPAAARQEALRLVAAFPVIVAAYHRLSQGLEPIAPRKDLLHTANFLYMLDGREAPIAFVRALDTYWNTVARIDRRRRDSVSNGLVIGFGSGALVGFLAGRAADSPACPRSGIECGQGALLGTVGGAVLGAVGGWLIDALARKPDVIYLSLAAP
jgi:hypothetical protein